MLFIAWDFKG